MEPARFELPFERLGPPGEVTSPISDQPTMAPGFQTADLQRESTERLRLGPPAAGPQAVIQLDLFRSINYAVHHGRDYQSKMEDMYISTLDVLLQRHAFEPQPFATQTIQYNRGLPDQNAKYNSALLATNTVGVRQRLPLGGEVTAKALVDFTDALNQNTADGESGQLALTGTIPLLRGAGMVNLEPLIQSERSLVYQIRDFENFRRDYVIRIARQYFSLIAQQQAVNNRRLKYLSSSNLVVQTRDVYAAGRITFFQVQQALQTALNDENALVVAEQSYQNSLDDFKILIGMPVERNLDVQGVELNVNIPDIDRPDLPELAIKYRLDLQTDRDRIEDARRQVDVSKNNLLPDLNLTASGDVNNTPDQAAVKIDRHQFEYSVGAQLDWPLDRVAERNQYRISLINFERAQRTYEQDRDQVISDARSSARSLKSAQISLDIQRRAIDLAQRKLDYSIELLTQGKAATRDVVDSQSDLLNARDRYDVAKADLQVQVLTLLRDTGTLRMDPDAGSVGHAMDLAATNSSGADNSSPKGRG
jgi:outer membrane protein TolC